MVVDAGAADRDFFDPLTPRAEADAELLDPL
jgi:hypothetical protein